MQGTRTCLLLLLNLFTCTEGQPDVIIKEVIFSVHPALEVERGTSLTLTCNAEVVHGGGHLPQKTYTFYKDYQNANHMQPVEARGNETLHIPQARAFHSGKYQCEVVIGAQTWKSTIQEVVVKGLQTPELIVDKLKVKEGENVSAICKAEEEEGMLTFSFKDGHNEVFRAVSSNGQVQNYIILNSGRTAELSCSYIIIVGIKQLNSNDSNVVRVEVQELSITPRIMINPSTEVIEADSVNISCQVDSDYQDSKSLSLQLVKGTKILKSDMKNGPYSKMVQAADAGDYECNAIMNRISKTTSAHLTVKELFSLPLLKISPFEVFEGQQFTITCESYEFASERIKKDEVKYYIYRNENLVTLGAFDGRHTTTAGSGTNGNYTCKAEVRSITKLSQAQIFRAKVLVSRPIIQVIGSVVLFRPFLIHCLSENGSFPITYTLQKNKSTLNHTVSRYPQDHAKFSAIIKSEDEIHEFKCEATNSPQHYLTSEALSVPVIVPVAEVFLTVIPPSDDVTEGHDVFLLCNINRGSHPVTYRWYRSDNKVLLESTTEMSNFSTHTLLKVSSKDSGSYYCEAFNSGTEAAQSNKVTFTVRLARWKKGLIGGMCLLCVSAVVLFLLLRYRAKRGRETYSPPSVVLAPHA